MQHMPTQGLSWYEWFEGVREVLVGNGDANPVAVLQAIDQVRAAAPTGPFVNVQHNTLQPKNGEVVFLDGNVVVHGDVVLSGRQEVVVVTSDLTADGDIVALGDDYSLIFVCGTLRARRIISTGEVVALGGIEASDLYWGSRSDYSTYAPRLAAPQVFQTEQRGDFLGMLEAQNVATGFKIAAAEAERLERDLQSSTQWPRLEAWLSENPILTKP
jgi:hypothetical protein